MLSNTTRNTKVSNYIYTFDHVFDTTTFIPVRKCFFVGGAELHLALVPPRSTRKKEIRDKPLCVQNISYQINSPTSHQRRSTTIHQATNLNFAKHKLFRDFRLNFGEIFTKKAN